MRVCLLPHNAKSNCAFVFPKSCPASLASLTFLLRKYILISGDENFFLYKNVYLDFDAKSMKKSKYERDSLLSSDSMAEFLVLLML